MAVSEAKRRVSISLPLSVLKDLTMFAFDRGETKSEIAEEAIIDFMSRQRSDDKQNQKQSK